MHKVYEIKEGARIAFRNRWLVTTLSLVIVIGVQNYGYKLQALVPQVAATTYERQLTEQEQQLKELDEYIEQYVTLKTEAIYLDNESLYREMARNQAIREANIKLLDLIEDEDNPHYQYVARKFKALGLE